MSVDENKIAQLQRYVDECSSIVFFGGAGVSTESGIPDFRSVDGIYRQKYDYPPETIISHDFLEEHPAEFYRFYREKLLYPAAKPNKAHEKLAEMEQKGKLRAVITQNIDGLHQAAGSKTVLELHGSTLRNYCTRCHKRYGVGQIPPYTGYPRCTCGGMIRPDVVLYGEMLDDDVIESALSEISRSDMLIVAGTSLRVYPAAGFIRYFRGKYMVMINKTATDADDDCSLVFHDAVGEVLSRIRV